MNRLEGVCAIPGAKPPEFRRHALELVAQGEPVARVTKDLMISESCLRRWVDGWGKALSMAVARKA